MEDIPCQRDQTHTSEWVCSCNSGGNFCSLCILGHMGSEGEQHTVRPLGPTGVHVCRRCHGQPADVLKFHYDVSLCEKCAASQTTVSESSGAPRSERLSRDNPNPALAYRIAAFGITTRTKLPSDTRPCSIASFLLKEMHTKPAAELEALITAFEESINHRNGLLLSTVMLLGDIYVKSSGEASIAALRFIRETIANLKLIPDLTETAKKNLETLIHKSVSAMRDSPHALLLFIQGVSQAAKDSMREPSFDTFSRLFDCQHSAMLLRTISRISNFQHYFYLLSLSCQHGDPFVTQAQSLIADIIVYLEQRGVAMQGLSKAFGDAVLSRPGDAIEVLTAVSGMLTKADYYADAHLLACQILTQFAASTNAVDTLCFAVSLATDLFDAGAQRACVVRLCERMLEVVADVEGAAFLDELRYQWTREALPQVIEKLARLKMEMTLSNLQESLPIEMQADVGLIVHVRPSSIRFFSIESNSWEDHIPLASRIQVSDASCWLFLDNDRIFCCGGTD